ncbi:SoxR reducing system RseC family protein [Marinitoga aeolica]|uniref:SoxR reducing system RseC family protein n=1 Tax=Marinitoga aeolica TaxID=2809031 RepID=A0ABY8PTH1_9BACT|nr:SoxR reducing system RseC family protein [Marinitoga aeolica]WGS65922.1 SoxR reducing system RseC family protein [Marinitoga aeolica]
MNELMRIVDIDEEYVYLQALEASNCSSCAIKGSCNLTGDPNRKIKAINSNKLDLNRNEFVYIKKIDSLESKVAFIMYGIPLLTMVIITVLLFSFGLNEIISFILGLTGMLISYYFIHLYDKKVAKTKYVPEIIEKVGIYKTFQI